MSDIRIKSERSPYKQQWIDTGKVSSSNLKYLIRLSKEELVEEMWIADPYIKKILKSSKKLHVARNLLYDYLNSLERHYFNIYSDKYYKNIHILEKNNAKECIRVFKNIIRTENEHLTGFSALQVLYDISRGRKCALDKVDEGFLLEFIYLMKGINGRSDIYSETLMGQSDYNDDRESAINRSDFLDTYSRKMTDYFKTYYRGIDDTAVKKYSENKNRILEYFNSTGKDWEDYKWHMSHIVKDAGTLSALVKLEEDEIEGLKMAEKYNIPFQITPYYLALFNRDGRDNRDHAVRAQVIPSAYYCTTVMKNRMEGIDLDFMGEKSTSPVDAITRRYPQILILKPYESCPQICVYCQRNWEIKGIDKAKVTRDKVRNAIGWIRDHETISEVLVTGGDPLTLSNRYIEWLIGELSSISHIERIRIGTRVLVTLPYRIDDGFIDVLARYHVPGKREICIVTHFEHPAEVTPDSLKAVQKIKRLGINVYNQQVFTYYNSRKFESSLLRKTLKISGIDPYYTFNTKGKEETIDFRVPIARIEQERKEEARLLPGIVRTDDPVFNVPRLGKSSLRAWQDHEVIMILPDGRRSYRFYPWESKLTLCDTYIYTDVSIYDYIKRLHKDGEDVDEYRSIWYYF